MPIIDGVGHGDDTRRKHEELQGIVSMVANIVKKNLTPGRPLLYVETNAGNGRNPSDATDDGSPLWADAILHRSIAGLYTMVLCELDETKASDLRDTFATRGSSPLILAGDNRIVIPSYCQRLLYSPFGVLFHDPNNYPDIELLSGLSRQWQFRQMDFVIYVHANGIKRARGQGAQIPQLDAVLEINKSHWVIRELSGAWQRTMLIGTNYAKFPVWRNRGYVEIESAAGRAIWARAVWTDDERARQYQPSLPGDW